MRPRSVTSTSPSSSTCTTSSNCCCCVIEKGAPEWVLPFFVLCEGVLLSFPRKGGCFSAQGAEGGRTACRHGGREGYLFFKKRYPSLKPSQRKFTLRVCSLKSCAACGIGCLRFSVSKRFGLLLSSLSLCLRIGSLMQFPSTLDFCCLAFACQSGIASLAARMGAVGRHCCARRRMGLNLRS